MQNFILDDDGLTITRYIEAVEGISNAMRVTFRPTASRPQKAVEDRISQLQARGKTGEAEDLVSATIAERIHAWEVLEADGKLVDGIPKPSAEWVDRLCPYLQKRVFMIVYAQIDGGDVDPQSEAKAKPTSAIEAVAESLGN